MDIFRGKWTSSGEGTPWAGQVAVSGDREGGAVSTTSVADLLAALEARGVRLRANGDRLVYEAPAGALTDADREVLKAAKPAVLAYLRSQRASSTTDVNWSRVSLYQLDRALEVAVPWADVPLILAPGCRIARELRTQDPNPGRVCCVCEVLDLLLSGVTPADARALATAR